MKLCDRVMPYVIVALWSAEMLWNRLHGRRSMIFARGFGR